MTDLLVWDLIIEKFDEKMQFFNFLVLNKKFNELMKKKEFTNPFFYYLRFKKHLINYGEIDWKRVFDIKNNLNKCNQCNKDFEEGSIIRLYKIKILTDSYFNHFFYFPTLMLCQNCPLQDVPKGSEKIDCEFRCLESEKEKHVRIFFSTFSTKKFIFIVNKEITKNDIVGNIYAGHRSFNLVFMGKGINPNKEGLFESLDYHYHQTFVKNDKYFNNFNFYIALRG